MADLDEYYDHNAKWLQQMRDGKIKIGFNFNLSSPLATELIAFQGYDWLMVDTQHSAVNRETLLTLLQAIKLGGAKSFVRVEGPTDRAGIQQAIDLGADGVLVPYICTAQDVVQSLSFAKYPGVGGIEGTRSLYVNIRPQLAAGSGIPGLIQYYPKANKNTIFAIQIETKASIDNLDEILAVPGLDLAFIGPGDLASSMGLLDKGLAAFADPEFGAAVGAVLGGCAKHNVIPGMWSNDGAAAKIGFKWICAGADAELLRAAAEEHVKKLSADLADVGWTQRPMPKDPSHI